MTTASRIRPTAWPWYSPVTAVAASAWPGPAARRPVTRVCGVSALTYQRHRQAPVVAPARQANGVPWRPPRHPVVLIRSEGDLRDPVQAARQGGEAVAGQHADRQRAAGVLVVRQG